MIPLLWPHPPTLIHQTSAEVWSLSDALPANVRSLADKNFAIFQKDARHPSLHFKSVGRSRSVRVGAHCRALAVEILGGCLWF